MDETIGKKAFHGTLWSGFDRFGVMILQFIVNLILARLLTPADFGAIGMLLIFLTVSQVFVDSGFGSALIQKKNPTEKDYSTIFFWNIGIGICLYLTLYFFAPLIANFYKLPILTDVLRAIEVTLIFSCITNIQINRLQKKLEFKKIAITDISSYLISSIVAITMAYHGYGVWSLVMMMILQGISRILLLYLISKWLPKLTFSLSAFKSLLSFGGFLFCANVLETICKNAQGIIIGKVFSASQMGYYSQASKLDNITSTSIPQVIAGVMYPVFSQFQDDKKVLGDMVIKNLRLISFLIYPLLGTMICIAYPLIDFLYGDQWQQSAPYFQILCVGGFFLCLNNITYYAVAACGKSKSLLLSSVYKWSIYAGLLILGLNYGMIGVMWSISLGVINIFFINSFLVKKYIGVGFLRIFKTFTPSLLMIVFAMIGYGIFNKIYTLPWYIGGAVVIMTYFIAAYLFRKDEMRYCSNLLMTFVKKINVND